MSCDGQTRNRMLNGVCENVGVNGLGFCLDSEVLTMVMVSAFVFNILFEKRSFDYGNVFGIVDPFGINDSCKNCQFIQIVCSCCWKI